MGSKSARVRCRSRVRRSPGGVRVRPERRLSGQPPAPTPSTAAERPDRGPVLRGSRLAPGLYELADGRAQAVGVLEYRDLEGGTWVIVGGTEAEGNVGEVVAVIANPDRAVRSSSRSRVSWWWRTGTKLDGASIRMAGPEIEVKTIEAIKDSGGPAD